MREPNPQTLGTPSSKRTAAKTNAARSFTALQCPKRAFRAETLVEANGEGGENHRRVGASVASERLVHMFEAALNRNPVTGQERQLRRAMRKLFQSGESVDRGDFADGVHLGMNIERRKAGGALAELGDPHAELLPDVAQRP